MLMLVTFYTKVFIKSVIKFKTFLQTQQRNETGIETAKLTVKFFFQLHRRSFQKPQNHNNRRFHVHVFDNIPVVFFIIFFSSTTYVFCVCWMFWAVGTFFGFSKQIIVFFSKNSTRFQTWFAKKKPVFNDEKSISVIEINTIIFIKASLINPIHRHIYKLCERFENILIINFYEIKLIKTIIEFIKLLPKAILNDSWNCFFRVDNFVPHVCLYIEFFEKITDGGNGHEFWLF